jgi:hypothetical protein
MWHLAPPHAGYRHPFGCIPRYKDLRAAAYIPKIHTHTHTHLQPAGELGQFRFSAPELLLSVHQLLLFTCKLCSIVGSAGFRAAAKAQPAGARGCCSRLGWGQALWLGGLRRTVQLACDLTVVSHASDVLDKFGLLLYLMGWITLGWSPHFNEVYG